MLVTQAMIDKAIEDGSARECALILRSEWDSLSVSEVEDLTMRLIDEVLKQ